MSTPSTCDVKRKLVHATSTYSALAVPFADPDEAVSLSLWLARNASRSKTRTSKIPPIKRNPFATEPNIQLVTKVLIAPGDQAKNAHKALKSLLEGLSLQGDDLLCTTSPSGRTVFELISS